MKDWQTCIDRLRGLIAECPEDRLMPSWQADAVAALHDLEAEHSSHAAPQSVMCYAPRSADQPQDCSWPFCGCDPYADKVLAAIEAQAPGLFAIHRENEALRAKIQECCATENPKPVTR